MAIRPHDFQNLTDVRISGAFGAPVIGAVIDSRKVVPGNLFVALAGENTDGHQFIPQAIERGATAVLCSESWAGTVSRTYSIPQISVPDVTLALGELAGNHRRHYKIPILAVTGTNGKTTTKNMIAAVLEKRYNLLKTEGNLNNQLGLPLTLLNLDDSYSAAVLEMGASHSGDIAYLCKIADPTEGLITNIGHAHLEYFKSIENVRAVKDELFTYLVPNGTVYINSDDQNIVPLGQKIKTEKIVTFSQHDSAGMPLKSSGEDAWGCHLMELDHDVQIQLKVSGQAMVQNASAAIAVGLTHGVPVQDIKTALESYSGEKGRMQRVDINGFHVIHDAYNANPESTRLSITTLAKFRFAKRRIVVFADMLELGETSRNEHQEIGKIISENGIDAAFLYGTETRFTAEVLQNFPAIHTRHFQDKVELGNALFEYLQSGDVVLLKGSRGMGLETLIPILEGQK